MNIANINRLIETLESLPPSQFSMGTWLHKNDCGTVGCIAGHAALLDGWDPEKTVSFNGEAFRGGGIAERAQEWLGLDSRTARVLFMPELDAIGGARDNPYERTASEVALVVRHLALTRHVRWDVLRE